MLYAILTQFHIKTYYTFIFEQNLDFSYYHDIQNHLFSKDSILYLRSMFTENSPVEKILIVFLCFGHTCFQWLKFLGNSFGWIIQIYVFGINVPKMISN